MNPRTAVHAALVALALAVATPEAIAKENYHEKALNADTRDKFEAVASDVRKEMEPGGRYEYIKPEERQTVDRKLSEMEALLSASDVAAMKQDDKIKLFNAQEIVNSILTRRDSDRVICKNETKVGSHIPTTNCHTYGQEEEARRGTHNQLDEWLRRGCAVAGCVGASGKGSEDRSGKQ
jgi:hypothetical protein